MPEYLKQRLLRLLKVPPQPDPPAGAPESVRVFRAAKNFYWLNVIKWFGTQAAALAGLYLFVLGPLGGPEANWAEVLQKVATAGYILQLPITFVLVRLDYSLRWYIVTDRSLRIREGVQHVREMTMTFANIQQITIHQGPLQRLLGISDLHVRSAGGGGAEQGGRKSGDSMHIGYFRGVSNAQEVRNLMIERLQRLRDTGLGDPDERAEAVPAPDRQDPVIVAAREMLAEATALRQALASDGRNGGPDPAASGPV
jgi:uncharacterized membrane protein YdbT with pleckstrin-like domain